MNAKYVNVTIGFYVKYRVRFYRIKPSLYLGKY